MATALADGSRTRRNPTGDRASGGAPARALEYPQFRIMGSKHRLLPWLHDVLADLRFDSALDAFAGSGCVSYLLKSMGKQVHSNDFLRFPVEIATALTRNDSVTLSPAELKRLMSPRAAAPDFIERTFSGIFYSPKDLRFLDAASFNIHALRNPLRRALALTALLRACLKRQPRGVFTVAGDGSRYDDGRRDLQLSIQEHFVEQVEVLNRCVFSNGREHTTSHGDIFAVSPRAADLVYMDPPYVPRADDNCYVKRYHFIEGLVSYWRDADILYDTRVRKLKKPFTPFSYRSSAIAAFERLFSHFRRSTLVLSYSSNAYPDLPVLVALMKKHKRRVDVFERQHRYHFGTHSKALRSKVKEYLVLGT
jgi:adenine-specific DNA-methyltransferase